MIGILLWKVFTLICVLALFCSPVAIVWCLIDRQLGETFWVNVEERIGTDVLWALFSFQKRINRKKWWVLHLCRNAVLSAVIIGFIAIELFIGGFDVAERSIYETPVFLSVFIPMFLLYWCSPWALNAKRWHDRDKSAWRVLLELIPVIGSLWIVIELGFFKGTTGPNRFGPDPLE